MSSPVINSKYRRLQTVDRSKLPNKYPLSPGCPGWGSRGQNVSCLSCMFTFMCEHVRILDMYGADAAEAYFFKKNMYDVPTSDIWPYPKTTKYRIGLFQEDYISKWSPHVCTSSPAEMCACMATHHYEKNGYDVDIVTLADPREIESFQCDAIMIMANVSTGHFRFCNPTYARNMRRIRDIISNKLIPAIIFWPDAIFHFNKWTALFKNVDVVVSPYLPSNSFASHIAKDVPWVVAHFGTVENIGTIYRRIFMKHITFSQGIKIVFPCNNTSVSYQERTQKNKGSRYWYMKEVLTRLLPEDVKVDVYGYGWKGYKLPRFNFRGPSFDGTPFREAHYILEIVEDDIREKWESAGFNSDRITIALDHGAHLVTNMKWYRSCFRSVRSIEDPKFEKYTTGALLYDANQLSWKRRAKGIGKALINALEKIEWKCQK